MLFSFSNVDEPEALIKVNGGTGIVFINVKKVLYDAVSVSKLFILAIAEFEFSHRWIILDIAKFDFSDGWIILAIAEFEFSHG